MDIISFITGFAVAGFIGTIIECILTVKKDREIKSLQKEFVQATNEIHFVEVKKIEFLSGDTDIKDGMQKVIDYATKNDCYVDFEINGCNFHGFCKEFL